MYLTYLAKIGVLSRPNLITAPVRGILMRAVEGATPTRTSLNYKKRENAETISYVFSPKTAHKSPQTTM